LESSGEGLLHWSIGPRAGQLSGGARPRPDRLPAFFLRLAPHAPLPAGTYTTLPSYERRDVFWLGCEYDPASQQLD
jgi:hypothetical protein